jgi:hypothetical protein
LIVFLVRLFSFARLYFARVCRAGMTTWAHIVGYAAFPGDARYEVRACVYCGAIVGADMKPINMDSPPHHTPFTDTLSSIFDNMCVGSRQYAAVADPAERAGLFACLNCFNCITRRRKHSTSLHPLAALWWEITTKRRWTSKSMDARVVKRLCVALVAPGATPHAVLDATCVEPALTNYYYVCGIFTSSQQRLVARIAAHGIADLPFLIADHLQQDNIQTLFLQNAPLAEFVRQYTLSYQPHQHT